MDFLRIATRLKLWFLLSSTNLQKIRDNLRENSKNTIFWHLMSYNPGLRIVSENSPCGFSDIMVCYLHAKNQENP